MGLHTVVVPADPPLADAAGSAPGEDSLAQIGEVAERLGLSLRTLRHWEEVGLVAPSARSDGGYRLYSKEDIERLALVMRMKPLGLALSEMCRLLALLEGGADLRPLSDAELAAKSTELRTYLQRTEEAVEKLERRLHEGRELRSHLTTLIESCESTLRRRRLHA